MAAKYLVCFLLLFPWCVCGYGQQVKLSLSITDDGRTPLAGVTVKDGAGNIVAKSDKNGNAALTTTTLPTVYHLSFIGYRDTSLTVYGAGHHTIAMAQVSNSIEEVTVNVGMYRIPRERATGSFTYIDRELLDRSPSLDILERLDGVAEGVLFDRSHFQNENQSGYTSQIRLRGLSTIESDRSPLIVVDDFPYDGDISSINPEDVESITILKDAAAASIWGARAGNGVIVITTKKGSYDQPIDISFSSYFSVQDKPDLFYSPQFLDAPTVLAIEEELFDINFYNERPQTPIPLYTEWLIKERDGMISADELAEARHRFASSDIRRESLRHLYRRGSTQTYNMAMRGGGARHSFRWSATYDRSLASIIGNERNRININASNAIKLSPKLTFTNELWYSLVSGQSNGVGISDLRGSEFTIAPYLRLLDDDGTPAATVRTYRYAYQEEAVENGLLDWMYRPLDERRLIDRQSRSKEFRVNTGLEYAAKEWLRLAVRYQISDGDVSSYVHNRKESFYVRNLVNRYTQPDGSLVIPHGDILRYDSPAKSIAHHGRAQVSGSIGWRGKNQIDYLSGMDVSGSVNRRLPFQIIYDYDPELLSGNTYFDYTRLFSLRPTGSGRVPSQGQGHSESVSRALSYYANLNYGFGAKYRFSGSARWDGANIYGVKTNQKGVPLWSLGGLWNVSEESFFRSNALDQLKLRMTYGSSGNSSRNVSVYPIISYDNDGLTNINSAILRDVGNPSLRWERVETTNVGVDFSLFNSLVSGSFDYYRKNSVDLIGVNLMDPTTGIIDDVLPLVTSNINYASLKGKGWDANIRFHPVRNKFDWKSSVIVSYARNEVTEFYTNYPSDPGAFISRTPPVLGESLDAMFVFPWHGLDDTGKPIIYIDGERSEDYTSYYRNYPIDRLVNIGERVPPFTASMLNNFQYGHLTMGFSLQWRAGHYFRRTTMPSTGEFGGYYHRDYHKRWQKPGDEAFTGVPAKVSERNSAIDIQNGLVAVSAYVIEKGDVLRLQNVFVTYSLSEALSFIPKVKRLNASLVLNNLGVLWRANKQGLDPDYPGSTYPVPTSATLRLIMDF